MSFRWSRAAAVARKEVYHVLRDPFTLMLSLGLPVFLVFVFGFAIEFNVEDLRLAVVDADRTRSSRQLIDTFGSSGYFIVEPAPSPDGAFRALTGDRARAALLIPGDFEKDLYAGRGAHAQILLDGTDNSTVGPILGYVGAIESIAAERIGDFDPPERVDVQARFLFNSELNSRWFVIPGLGVVVMAILSVLLTALAVAREWENGSMELLLSTPVEPLEIIAGKIAPYAVLGVAAMAFIFVISLTVFAVPFRGSLLVYGAGTLLFLAAYLAQGMLISVLTRNQLVAMQVAIMSGLIPANLLSGFIFPIESMPLFFQYLTMIMPARWLTDIARESHLKGASLLDMWEAFAALAVLAAVTVALAVTRFKRNVEP
ncbi:membrane protein [Sulfurifustis variabilis]|uniref:Membrane protein n=1 Tax=Sulfurifustis variabilis TaxID=1675686 RepID=A0A1B4V4A0_9GAMM|nr:ABC transporter permease [Sulfurifustis variabilis]BAU48339.1 membrane protein [Sulfurifustis variabilis]